MKPDPLYLNPSIYPWTVEMAPRFGDMDMFAHLNNVAIARHFEEARVRFQFEQYGPEMLTPAALKKMRMVVVQSNLSYLEEGAYPDTLVCGAGITRVGRSSYALLSVLWQQGKAIALQECVMVLLNDDGPIALPDMLRQQMQAWMIRQPVPA